MVKKEKKWVLFGLAALAMNVMVPYGLLKDRDTIGGSFLFWCIVTLIVMGAGFAVMSCWAREGDSKCR